VLSDSDELGQVQVAVWQEAYPGMVDQDYLDSLTVESSAQLWPELLGPDSPRPAARFIAIAPDGSIAGITASGASRSDHVVQAEELYDLEVLAEHRGSGVADLLMRSAIGDRPAELWVLRGNRRARAFYERQGFAANGDTDEVPDLGIVEIRMVRG
jgi:ribosomal protein S18 acetylase RimI-like enzyme